MNRNVIEFHRGKLQVAATIIGDTSRLYCDCPAVQQEMATAYYALNRADAALIAESQKPSPNKRKPKRRNYYEQATV